MLVIRALSKGNTDFLYASSKGEDRTKQADQPLCYSLSGKHEATLGNVKI